MTQPRSSLAIALQDYKPLLGIRPGVALTIAAICLLAAVVVGMLHVVWLGQSGAAIAEGRRTVRTLHSYNAALEAWRQMATLPDSELQFPAQRRFRDSIATALRIEFTTLQGDLRDSADKVLVEQVLGDLKPATAAAMKAGAPDLGTQGRSAMIVLTARQDASLFRAAQRYQSSQMLAAVLIGLIVLAAVLLIVPIAWVYVRYKRGVPPGM